MIDYGSAFVTYGNEIESKGVQFPGRDAPDKINSTAWNEGAVIQDMRDATIIKLYKNKGDRSV